MVSVKDLKKKYRPIFWKDPDSYYPTKILKAEGYHRNTCKECKKPFWNTDKDRKVCGDPACAPGESFAFIGKSPAKNKFTYVQAWQKFQEMFEGFGYTTVKRYPVVARWNPTVDFTIASIAAFQPYVISGEAKAPAEWVTIPQFCLRFNDIDNVGITMSHYTGFVMVGQLMFVEPKKWDQQAAFEHMHKWNTEALGIPKEEITYIEDVWAGGGNLGCCLESFTRGLEIWNQVYMMYEVDDEGNAKDLDLKVLDMGLGLERAPWITQGTVTSFDAVFPDVLKKLFKKTGYKKDDELLHKFVPYAGMLNIDEVEDIDKAWEEVAKNVGIPSTELREKIEPLSGIYSIAEHARSLLFSLNDGALPSNVGGGYNLRILLRRALSFIDRYKWDIYLPDVCKWHAEELKPIFPELSENLDTIKKILDVEQAKYDATKQKAKQIVEKLVESQEKVDTEKLIELYDSKGISPAMIKDAAAKAGKELHVPDNFYALVAERHEKQEEQETQTKKSTKLDLSGVQLTEPLYFKDWRKHEFKAKVLKIIDDKVVLNETYFYPTSGGQAFDKGTINGQNVIDVFKQGGHIIHKLETNANFKEGDEVKCDIDWERRFQLAQHHTGTHVLNAAAKQVLGHHVNQAGAKKTTEKAHLDITHFESLDQQTIEKIEKVANKLINDHIKIEKFFLARDEAEEKYGMEIYQGGAVPGNSLRIVNIPNIDVECCGGTHLDNTDEIQQLKITKASKISDAIVRITFVAGKAAQELVQKEGSIIDDAIAILGGKPNQLPARAKELFTKWKKVKKLKKQNKEILQEMFTLSETSTSEGDVVQLAAQELKTQPEHLIKTLQRFKKELEGWK